jgi:hypothetical protein
VFIDGRVLHKLLKQFPNISEEDFGYMRFKHQKKDLLNIKSLPYLSVSQRGPASDVTGF